MEWIEPLVVYFALMNECLTCFILLDFLILHYCCVDGELSDIEYPFAAMLISVMALATCNHRFFARICVSLKVGYCLHGFPVQF